MYKHIGKILLLILFSQINGVFAQEIDNKKSSILFTVTDLGIEIEGKFRTFSGTVSFTPEDLEQSVFQITIPVKSINTENRMRDEHLREEEFFDAANYPNIVFTAQEVTKNKDHFIVTGMLSIKGKSKQISIPFTYKNASFSGHFSLDRNDYKVGGSGFLDTIGDEINIQINCILKADE